MDGRLEDMIKALSPAMNAIQAEGFLHVAAFPCRKTLDLLGHEDLPAIEQAVREALRYTASADSADEVCERLRHAMSDPAGGTEV